MASMVETVLWTKKTCPPRSSSLVMADMISSSSKRAMTVSMDLRSAGGVSMTESSRSPEMAMLSVLGMGVAVSVSTSTSDRIDFIFSLCLTPNRCSSSTIRRPRSLNFVLSEIRACVPMTMSTLPASRSARISRFPEEAPMLESASTLTGHFSILSRKVTRCWWARRVVGTRTATCRPDIAATKAARRATSVFPYPTSPHTSLSMGRVEARSA